MRFRSGPDGRLGRLPFTLYLFPGPKFFLHAKLFRLRRQDGLTGEMLGNRERLACLSMITARDVPLTLRESCESRLVGLDGKMVGTERISPSHQAAGSLQLDARRRTCTAGKDKSEEQRDR
ncbi:hypothetical protein SAMN05660860_00614 [Geoalkalibacter ferrihydriticus]|uniref:Uncharacterized protein n=1 Tax=Geoalkalibacter ferrihydriticus TaxID=392333 RepID=A0A1G9K1Y0_9BACT|nr:hypothetical protein SAMN05660860_00614 [Geoalkalibacter ferrihydriticus]